MKKLFLVLCIVFFSSSALSWNSWGLQPYGYGVQPYGYGVQPYGAQSYGLPTYGVQPYGAQAYGYPAYPYAPPLGATNLQSFETGDLRLTEGYLGGRPFSSQRWGDDKFEIINGTVGGRRFDCTRIDLGSFNSLDCR
jgi:hypothetical protein